MAIPRLLVVDDDSDMRSMVAEFLNKQGIIVLSAGCAEEIASELEKGRIDLILLDVMLGDESGIAICQKLREKHSVPIIMFSALSSDLHRMKGYEVGADDYIAKPFNPDLLLARIRAVLRRGKRAASLSYRRDTNSYSFNGWHYDGKRNEVRAPDGYQALLSKRETQLLKVFLANSFIPLKREEIASMLDVALDQIETQDFSGRAIDMLVGRLRGKIEKNPKDPQMLRTERGIGYVFAVEVELTELQP